MLYTLTVCITIGGIAERTIRIASQTFLFDSAYARRAENAAKRLALAHKRFEKELVVRTAECDRSQYPGNGLRPYIRPTAIMRVNNGVSKDGHPLC